jgi:hypothetical protein
MGNGHQISRVSIDEATAPAREPVGHVLKTWPALFQANADGRMPFNVRHDDRDFQVGDRVILVEYDPKTDTNSGRVLERRISFLVRGKPLPKGYCAFSFEGSRVMSFKEFSAMVGAPTPWAAIPGV